MDMVVDCPRDHLVTMARMMMVFLSMIPLVAGPGCADPGRFPHAGFPPIVEEYYVCPKCESLDGGIYGKGPKESFVTSAAARCSHDWQQISRRDFQGLASQRFPKEWSEVGWYLKRP